MTTTETLARLRRLVVARTGDDVRRVAVIGNAPLAPDAERAAALDSADIVFRVNGFALDRRGEPPSVGTKTNVVVLTRGTRATRWVFDRYRERVYLLVEPARMTWEPEVVPGWWPPDLGWVAVPNREVTIPLASALGLDPRAAGEWATTGTYAAWLGHELFPDAELLLAGYSFVTNRHQTSWAHAVGDDCAIGPEHRIEREGELLSRWESIDEATILS